MDKNSLRKIIEMDLGKLPLEKKLQELDKLNDRMSQLCKELKEKYKKNMIYCDKCKKYSKDKEFKREIEKQNILGTTYTDCGYGDDDRYGEMEYLYHYLICPKCGNKMVKKRTYLRTLWEKRRRE